MRRKLVCSRSGSGLKCTGSSCRQRPRAELVNARFRTSGRRAGQRFDAEHHVTTEALIFLSTLDPEAIGPNLEFATHYEPTPIREAEALLDAIPEPLASTTFIDVGSGMGRVVLLAARRPFKMVAGIEISGALHEVARENVARFDKDALQCHDIRLIRGDAAEYKFPRGTLAVYLYNPFRENILTSVLERLLAQPREIRLLYHTPVGREVIEATGAFELERELSYAAIFRRVHPKPDC